MAEESIPGAPTTTTTAPTGEGPGQAPGASGIPPDASLLHAGQTGNILDWRSDLPENLRTHSVLQQHHTREAAAKTLIAQAEMIGRGIYLPRDDAPPETKAEAMAKIYARLGRPDTAKDYTIPIPAGSVGWDQEMETRFRTTAHSLGLTQAQVEGLMAFDTQRGAYFQNIVAGNEARSFADGRNALHAEFGAATEEVIGRARSFFEHFGAGAFGGHAGEQAWEQIMQATLPDGSKLSNSPYLMAAFSEAGNRMGEGVWRDSEYYVAGGNTLETLTARKDVLTAKRHAQSITAEESTELGKIFQQLAAQNERQQARGARVA